MDQWMLSRSGLTSVGVKGNDEEKGSIVLTLGELYDI